MEVIVTDKSLFDGIRKAFEGREQLTLTGLGLEAKYVCENLEYRPFGFPLYGPKPAVGLVLKQITQVTAAPTWNGDGLPPVGLEVEAWYSMDTLPGWKPFKLKYLSEESVVFEGMGETYASRETFDGYGLKFRPIRTAEQIAAEEREKAIEEMSEIARAAVADNPRGGVGAAALYDAGYRKQVEQ